MAADLLIDVVKHLKKDPSHHQYAGSVAAKYLETLQRSNEQLVKVVTLLQKKQGSTESLSDIDKTEIFDMLHGEKN